MNQEIFRNPEWRRFLLPAGLGSLAGALTAGFFWGPACGCYMFLVCLFLLAGFWYFTGRRYEHLGELSGILEEILYGNDSLRLVPDEEGELAVLADRIYKMTLRLREQAEQLQAEKSYLKDSLEDISHQIKTPLAAAGLVFQRLRNPGLSKEERFALAVEAGMLLERVNTLVELLLKTARLESGTVALTKEKIQVYTVVHQALEPLEIPLELKNITVQKEIPKDVSYEGDFLWSVEAVENLIKNCMEHTPEGGSIRITALENPLYTEICIRDTGPGFSEEDMPHLFERFFRGKNENIPGNGIGLSLAANIWKQQNGTIKAANRPEGGAEFRIRILK